MSKAAQPATPPRRKTFPVRLAKFFMPPMKKKAAAVRVLQHGTPRPKRQHASAGPPVDFSHLAGPAPMASKPTPAEISAGWDAAFAAAGFLPPAELTDEVSRSWAAAMAPFRSPPNSGNRR